MGEQEKQTSRRDFLELATAGLAGITLAASNATPVAAQERDAPSMAGDAASGGARSGGIDLPNLTIAAAAERIRKKQLSPVELTQAILNRIEALNPKLGAFITVVPEQAMEAARAAEEDIQRGKCRGQLHGVPD